MTNPNIGWGATAPAQADTPSQPPQTQTAPVANTPAAMLPVPDTAPAIGQAPPVQATPPAQAPPVSTPPPVVPTTETPTDTTESIQSLLREFAKKPGCDRYSTDSDKIKLLVDYLWIRQLTPDLSFAKFLELYASVADFDDTNLKHPDDAIKTLLPRSKKKAEESGRQQWTAREVVDFAALYVDMIRTAETTRAPIPMTLNEFLVAPNIIEGMKAGQFKEEAPKKTKSKSKKKTKTVQRPTGPNQRVVYTQADGRQHRGQTINHWIDQGNQLPYFHFQADSGEVFESLGAECLELVDDPAPNPPQNNEGDPLPEKASGKLTIKKAEWPSVAQALSLEQPMGTVAIGDSCYEFQHVFPDNRVAVIEVINAETGPYVDARLVQGDTVLYDIDPRKNIEGLYSFETPEGAYTLEVTANK